MNVLGRTLSPTVLVVLAATIFGFGNTAYRTGTGTIAFTAAARVAVGFILFLPMIITAVRTRTLAAALRDPLALLSIVLSGSTMWSAAFLFRSVPGPTAAVALAVTPACALVIGRFVGARAVSRRVMGAVIVCVALALLAAPHDGASVLAAALPATLFLLTDVASVLVQELARRRHAAPTLIAGGLLVGSLPVPLVLFTSVGALDSGFSAVSGALTVGVLGTVGRLFRAQALGSISASVVAASTQITALITAIGGVVFFADQLSIGRFVALLAACAACFVALLWAAEAPTSVPTVGSPDPATGALPAPS